MGQSPLAGGSGDGCPPKLSLKSSATTNWHTHTQTGPLARKYPTEVINQSNHAPRGSNGAEPLGRGLGGRQSPKVKSEIACHHELAHPHANGAFSAQVRN